MTKRHGQTIFIIKGEETILDTPLMATRAAQPAAAVADVESDTRRLLRFSRLFPPTEVPAPDPNQLKKLADIMQDIEPLDSLIPAGFTYLGQFVDHDITNNNQGRIEVDQLTVEELIQERTPSLDLDSLYGLGPAHETEMYVNDQDGQPTLLRIGPTIGTNFPPGDVQANSVFPNDLPRKPGSKDAVIGDARNDENLIVAQTHVAFLKFHNAVVNRMRSPEIGLVGHELFEAARRKVTLHYQWIVLNDFVRKIVDQSILDSVLATPIQGRLFQVAAGEEPTMPIEFSVAAYRLGHSMIRAVYDYNRVFSLATIPATLELLFKFTGLSGDLGKIGAPGANGENLPSNWIIDWNRFYDFENGQLSNHARKIDAQLTDPLRTLPGGAAQVGPAGDNRFTSASLAVRNLLRGRLVRLPTGQEVAAALGQSIPVALQQSLDQLPKGLAEFSTQTPLWFYILKEAEVLNSGERLGPIGSRIVAETFVGLIQHSRTSILAASHWTPNLPAKTPGTFTMVDLLNFVGDLNPLG